MGAGLCQTDEGTIARREAALAQSGVAFFATQSKGQASIVADPWCSTKDKSRAEGGAGHRGE